MSNFKSSNRPVPVLRNNWRLVSQTLPPSVDQVRAVFISQIVGVLIVCPGHGFNADDGASLLMAFRGLEAESVAQGQVHSNISKELSTLVADPFEDWALGHKVCHQVYLKLIYRADLYP